MIKHINNPVEFEEAVKQGDVLVDFFATWCGPCKMLAPVLEQLAEQKPDLLILKIDVDEVTPLAARFGIQSIPTLMFFKDGQRLETRLGYQNLMQLLEFVNR